MSSIIPDPIAPQADTLPAEADVVVIGGGIVGVSTALALAERKVRVVLCEKGLIGAEQSARNWGWVRQMGRDPAEIPLSVESLEIWRRLKERHGVETGFRQTGITYLCRNESEMKEYRDWLPHAREYGVDSRLLEPADLALRLPGISREFVGGMYTPTDGRAEPLMAAPAIARAAQAAGAQVFARCAVRGIERQAGRVSGVVTEAGTIRCGSVVLAGGAWSRLFAGTLGVDLPQLKVLGSAARIVTPVHAPDMPVGGTRFAFRKRLDGGYTMAMRNANMVPIVPDSFRLFSHFAPRLWANRRELRLRFNENSVREWRTPRHWPLDRISPFELTRILDPQPSLSVLREGLRHLSQAFPVFAEARITHAWGGLIDATPDAVPVMGPVAGIPGFHLATGFSGHGFGLGPGAGLLMAQLVMNEAPVVDPAPFRFDRFERAASLAAQAA
jgi:glycine/D-amino acid oxidase-like deaminating enzyme